jgi:uncharacterized protein YndB with AHSA1/START domain
LTNKETQMLKALKWLLILVLALAAFLFLGGYALSPKFTVSRAAVVNAPPSKVFGLIASPRQWKQWSVWNKRDPAMQIDYSGPESGTGAAWAWKSPSEGDGKMTFTAAEPDNKVAYDLYFPDFGTTSSGSFELVPEGGGTRVTWTMNGDMGSNPLFRWIALFADKMVGADFEAGLAGLRAVAEKGQ